MLLNNLSNLNNFAKVGRWGALIKKVCLDEALISLYTYYRQVGATRHRWWKLVVKNFLLHLIYYFVVEEPTEVCNWWWKLSFNCVVRSATSNFVGGDKGLTHADLEIILGFLVSWDLANKFSAKVRKSRPLKLQDFLYNFYFQKSHRKS